MASPLEQVFITGYNKGLSQNKKPFLIPDQAWQIMENAYTFRDRVLKREGLEFVGRLRRVLTNFFLGVTTGAITQNFADILASFRLNEPNAEIQQRDPGPPPSGGIVIDVGAGLATFTDNGDGTFTTTGTGDPATSFVNYITGQVQLGFTVAPAPGLPIVSTLGYYPTLSVMGISTQDQAGVNQEQTLIWDQRYCYIFVAGFFQEYLPLIATTWASSDSDFFYSYNYRQATSANRILFETNFVPNAANPMRFTNGATWTTFAPQVSGTFPPVGAYQAVVSAKIIVSYFSRLILLNTWEGLSDYSTAPVNFFARCRFSAEGDPTLPDAFLQDVFGKGGFLDAPTSESIIGAEFVQNTLIVSFERSKWQLRYVGEYGLPFIWERVTVDFGGESLFSTVQLDNAVLDVGDKAIVATTAVDTKRIDLEIPDQIFFINNQNNGPKRVWGIRQFYKELVYWCYPDATTGSPSFNPVRFPNKVLVYNYRNQTWAIFRDSVTCFGYFQYDLLSSPNVSWDSLKVFWDDEQITWDDIDQGNPGFQFVISGNQQGYIHLYASNTPDDPSLSIQDITVLPIPVTLTIPRHNLLFGEIIQITGMHFRQISTNAPLTTTLNNALYQVNPLTPNTVSLTIWDAANQTYTAVFPVQFFNGAIPVPLADVEYMGCGEVTLFPKLNIVSKDINIYQQQALATKLSHIDFLMQPQYNSAMTVNLWINSADFAVSGNITTGYTGISLNQDIAFYTQQSDYSWFRFHATTSCQYFNINLTYNNDLMNTLSTHQSQWTLYAINAAVKRGGKVMY